MATKAVEDIVNKYSKDILKDIDSIFVGTLTPGYLFPSTGSLVSKDLQEKFGINVGGKISFDINNACPSSLNAIQTAQAFMKAGYIKKALVVGTDKLTSMMSGFSRDTLMLFGDAAGAVVLEENMNDNIGVQGLNATLKNQDINDVIWKGFMAAESDLVSDKFHMDGQKIYMHGVEHIKKLINEYMEKNNLKITDFDYIIPHQANIRMLNTIGDHLHFDNAKILKTLHENGNTAAASPLLTLSKYKDIFKPGDRILMFSLGAGFSVALVDFVWSIDK